MDLVKRILIVFLMPITMGSLILLAAGCGSTTKRDDFAKIQKETLANDSADLKWRSDAESDKEIEKAIESLLAKPLSKEDAIQLAVYANPELQARFDSLGVAAADVWQAGLLKNPAIDFASKFPLSGGEPKIEAGLEFNITDLFMRGARVRMAEAEALENSLIVAQSVRNLIQETKEAYFEFQVGLHTLKLEQIVLDTEEQLLNLHKRLQAAGNINDLALAQSTVSVAMVRSELQTMQLDVQQRKERLQRLFGLWGKRTEWQIVDVLESVPDADPTVEMLEFTAVKNRGDLQGQLAGLESLKAELGAVKNLRWIPALDLGAGVISDFGEKFGVGPQLRWEIPLFDQGSAKIERLVNLYRMRLRRIENLAVEIRSEARQSRNKLIAARAQIEYYRKKILPERERITDETQLFYNGMLMGLPDLLKAKQEELKSQKEYLIYHKQYWIAYSELERVTASRFNHKKENSP